MLAFDEIFVTSKLEGLLHCLKTNTPAILYGEIRELKHKFLLERPNLPIFLDITQEKVVVNGENRSLFNSAESVQNQILTHMGMKGLLPFCEHLKELYVIDNLMLLTFDNLGSFDITYEKLTITDEVKLSGVDLNSTEIYDSYIIDYFKSEKLRSLSEDMIFPDDDILKQIYFWKEQNTVISVSKTRDVNHFDASWVPLKYKIRKNILNSSGQSLRLWPLKRVIEENVVYNYKNVENIKVLNELKCLKVLGI
jgi:hypothetical protein